MCKKYNEKSDQYQGRRKTIIQEIWDFIGSPFRFILFDQKWLPFFHWTTLDDERLNQVLPVVKGKLLDIGCGKNILVKMHGDGVGVDVFDWGGGAMVVENTAQLPFPDQSFDTITFLACLNHIPNRQEVLKEAKRLIKPEGILIITMINPIFGKIGHSVWWYSEDKHRGGMKDGEVGGLWSNDIIEICNSAGFNLAKKIKFEYGLNNVYIFKCRNNM